MPQNNTQKVELREVLSYKNEFVTIDDLSTYRRVTARLHAKGIVHRDEVEGLQIKTKRQQLCTSGDLLVAEIDAKVGGYGMIPAELDGAIVSSHYFLFEVDKWKLDPRYLEFFIKTDAFQQQISARGSTNYASIRPAEVLQIKMPLPTLNEQRRIVRQLERLLNSIDSALLEQNHQDLGMLWTSILSEAYQGKLTARVCSNESLHRPLNYKQTSYRSNNLDGTSTLKLPSRSKLPSVPSEWVFKTLGEIAFVTKLAGYEYTKYIQYMDDAEIPVIRAQNVTKDGFLPGNFVYVERELMEALHRSRVFGGEILMVYVGAGVGNTGIVPKGQEYFLGPNVAMIRLTNKCVDSRFIEYYLKSSFGKMSVFGFSKATAQGSVAMRNIRSVPVPIPSLPEQRIIVAMLDDIKAKLEDIQELRSQCDIEMQALIARVFDTAFSGTITNNNPGENA